MTPAKKYSEPITRDDANKLINNRMNLVKKMKGAHTHGVSADVEQFFSNEFNGFIFSRKRLNELFRQRSVAGNKLDTIVAIFGAEQDPKDPNGAMLPTIVLAACHSSENKDGTIHLVTPNTAHPGTETPPKITLKKLPDPS